jgi:predicted unusual protein kinase regulating ubiquinone biosynthesis (AarF/ABC1/UbiB family)
VTHNHPPHERHDRTCPACALCTDLEDAPTRPDLPRLQPLAMRIGNALAACPELEAEELCRALRALQRCTPADRARLIQSIERHAGRA